MRPRYIETPEDWEVMKRALQEKGFQLWVRQRNWKDTEGFRACFWRGDEQVEVFTHSRAVQMAIVGSGMG